MDAVFVDIARTAGHSVWAGAIDASSPDLSIILLLDINRQATIHVDIYMLRLAQAKTHIIIIQT